MKRVEVEVRERAAIITLLGEEPSHRLSSAMAKDIRSAIEEAQAKPGVRTLILQGGGQNFSVGADLKERAKLSAEQWQAHHTVFEQLALSLQTVPQPTIAAVRGWALGGGAELALGCDIVVAAPDAHFGQPEALRGLVPGMGGPQLLRKRLPHGMAAYLLYTGATITAADAVSLGLVTFIDDDPPQRALALAGEIAQASPGAVRALRRLLQRACEEFPTAYRQELAAWRAAVDSGDAAEGAQAFVEKRPPLFSDPS